MNTRKQISTALLATIVLASSSSLAMASDATATKVIDLRGDRAPAAPGSPYAARNLPDRIVRRHNIWH